MMMEDLLTLLPTPIMFPPMIVGVSPEGIADEFDEPSLWSVPTGFPTVGGGFAPEVAPAGCVPVWPNAPGCPGLPGPFNAFAGVPIPAAWGSWRFCRGLRLPIN